VPKGNDAMSEYKISGFDMDKIQEDVCNIPLANTINRFHRLIDKLKSLGMKFKPVDSFFYSERPINDYERYYDSKNDMWVYVESPHSVCQDLNSNDPK
jgi:hypothetical protein